jgi:prepilin-type N-terminal cleavage/methylation domain-containing protein
MTRVEGRESRVEQLRIADCGLRIFNLQSDIRNPKSFRSLNPRASVIRHSSLGISHSASAFTLIELLVAILIISILSAALLGVAAVAGETAREAKTRNIIARIHTLLMEQYDSYKSRRVKVRQTVLDAITSDTTTNAYQKGQLRQLAHLYALREMMMIEMPCRWSEVLLNAVPSSLLGSASDARCPMYLDPLGGASASASLPLNYRTPLAALYLRQYDRMVGAKNKLDQTRNNNQSDIVANEGAECLYMIVMNACGDGEAKSLFSESSIGDIDGDGAPEFLDGWGHPISFLRAAPGFVSDIQLNANDLPDSSAIPPTITTPNSTWETAAKGDHDPLDLFRIDLAAFRLVPLIISSGRDEAFGIRMSTDSTWQGISNPTATFSLPLTPFTTPVLSPYARVHDPSDNAMVYLGTIDTRDITTATDNIHNHLIGTR